MKRVDTVRMKVIEPQVTGNIGEQSPRVRILAEIGEAYTQIKARYL